MRYACINKCFVVFLRPQRDDNDKYKFKARNFLFLFCAWKKTFSFWMKCHINENSFDYYNKTHKKQWLLRVFIKSTRNIS